VYYFGLGAVFLFSSQMGVVLGLVGWGSFILASVVVVCFSSLCAPLVLLVVELPNNICRFKKKKKTFVSYK
jgi:hypothetical protein